MLLVCSTLPYLPFCCSLHLLLVAHSQLLGRTVVHQLLLRLCSTYLFPRRKWQLNIYTRALSPGLDGCASRTGCCLLGGLCDRAICAAYSLPGAVLQCIGQPRSANFACRCQLLAPAMSLQMLHNACTVCWHATTYLLHLDMWVPYTH